MCAQAVAATAPDSIAGKVYRETFLVVTTRTSSEKTIVFGSDGRFTYLKSGRGSPLVLAAPWKIILQPPRPDGTYVYRRTGDTSATLDLNFDDGSKETMLLGFSSAVGGAGGRDPASPDVSFCLTDLGAAQAAPASNVSMRGRVSQGHPLIVGFVVPGPARTAGSFVPPPDARQREVLIRVIGPSLAQFGLGSTWSDPDFQLYRGSAPAIVNQAHYADWSVPPSVSSISTGTEAAFRKVFSYLGAFPLLSGSKDSADVVRLDPGAYTVVCDLAPGDPGGEALIEVYFLP